MKDINQDALDLGIKEASKLLGKRVSRGKMSEEKAAKILSAITPTLEDKALSQCDMVVEAVVELEAVKKQVLPVVESLVAESAFITSNTSTISINRLAESLQRPDRTSVVCTFLIRCTRCHWWRLFAARKPPMNP